MKSEGAGVDDAGEQQDTLPEPSGWWRRVVAALVDFLVLLVPLVILALATHGIHWTHDPRTGRLVQHRSTVFIIGSIAIGIVYQAATLCRPGRHNGQTYGAQALGISVVRDDGQPFGATTYLIRQLLCQALPGYLLPLLGGYGPLLLLVVALDDLWPLWDPENRALHDMVAETHVLRAAPTPVTTALA